MTDELVGGTRGADVVVALCRVELPPVALWRGVTPRTVDDRFETTSARKRSQARRRAGGVGARRVVLTAACWSAGVDARPGHASAARRCTATLS